MWLSLKQHGLTSGPRLHLTDCNLCSSNQERGRCRSAADVSALPQTNKGKSGGRKEKTGRKQRERGKTCEGTAPCDCPGQELGCPLALDRRVMGGKGSESNSLYQKRL